MNESIQSLAPSMGRVLARPRGRAAGRGAPQREGPIGALSADRRANARFGRCQEAIMHAGVANYCRLTGVDEDPTQAHLSEYLDAIGNAVGRHPGVVAHRAGDAVLAQFHAPSGAVSCALGIQRLIRGRDAGLPRKRRVEFRTGINIGDVIADRDDLYGNAVNVLECLQSLGGNGRDRRARGGARGYRQRRLRRVTLHRRAARVEHRAPGARLLDARAARFAARRVAEPRRHHALALRVARGRHRPCRRHAS